MSRKALREPFEIKFPEGRSWFTGAVAAELIGLSASFRNLVILLAAKYQIPYEDVGAGRVIFSRASVMSLRIALLDYQKLHPKAGCRRGPNLKKMERLRRNQDQDQSSLRDAVEVAVAVEVEDPLAS